MSVSKIKISDDITTNDSSTAASTKAVNDLSKKISLPIGFEYFQTNPNVRAGHLPLIGGLWSRELYADLWAWVQTQTGYLISESEWQSKSSANDGAVPFYSDGDGKTTFRVPALTVWCKGKKGDEAIGSYLADSFKSHKHNVSVSTNGSHTHTRGTMNITGSLSIDPTNNNAGMDATGTGSGAITSTSKQGLGSDSDADGWNVWGGFTFDASKSWTGETSLNGGHTHTVTISEIGGTETKPKTIIGLYCVVAIGSVHTIGEATAEGILASVETTNNRVEEANTKIDNLNPIVTNIKNNYVDLSSQQTITGKKKFTSALVLKHGDNNAIVGEDDGTLLSICSGSSWSKGAFIDLYPEGNDNRPGGFTIGAKTTDKRCDIRGDIDGILTWCGNQIATYQSNKLIFPNGTQFWIS